MQTFLVRVKNQDLRFQKLRCYKEGLMGSDVYTKDQRSELRLILNGGCFVSSPYL